MKPFSWRWYWCLHASSCGHWWWLQRIVLVLIFYKVDIAIEVRIRTCSPVICLNFSKRHDCATAISPTKANEKYQPKFERGKQEGKSQTLSYCSRGRRTAQHVSHFQLAWWDSRGKVHMSRRHPINSFQAQHHGINDSWHDSGVASRLYHTYFIGGVGPASPISWGPPLQIWRILSGSCKYTERRCEMVGRSCRLWERSRRMNWVKRSVRGEPERWRARRARVPARLCLQRCYGRKRALLYR